MSASTRTLDQQEAVVTRLLASLPRTPEAIALLLLLHPNRDVARLAIDAVVANPEPGGCGTRPTRASLSALVQHAALPPGSDPAASIPPPETRDGVPFRGMSRIPARTWFIQSLATLVDEALKAYPPGHTSSDPSLAEALHLGLLAPHSRAAGSPNCKFRSMRRWMFQGIAASPAAARYGVSASLAPPAVNWSTPPIEDAFSHIHMSNSGALAGAPITLTLITPDMLTATLRDTMAAILHDAKIYASIATAIASYASQGASIPLSAIASAFAGSRGRGSPSRMRAHPLSANNPNPPTQSNPIIFYGVPTFFDADQEPDRVQARRAILRDIERRWLTQAAPDPSQPIPAFEAYLPAHGGTLEPLPQFMMDLAMGGRYTHDETVRMLSSHSALASFIQAYQIQQIAEKRRTAPLLSPHEIRRHLLHLAPWTQVRLADACLDTDPRFHEPSINPASFAKRHQEAIIPPTPDGQPALDAVAQAIDASPSSISGDRTVVSTCTPRAEAPDLHATALQPVDPCSDHLSAEEMARIDQEAALEVQAMLARQLGEDAQAKPPKVDPLA